MSKEGYHILLLEIINNRMIRAFKAKLKGEHLEVAGKTGTGKTTAISALWEILDPGQDRITHGEKKSIVKVILSDGETKIRAERQYVPSGSTVTITRHTDDDIETISAKEFKGMISDLSSNPHKIKEMKDKDRVKLLLSSAGIPEEDHETLNANISTAATELGEAQSERKKTAPGEEPEKADAVSGEALSEKIAGINEHNEKCRGAEEVLVRAIDAVRRADDEHNGIVINIDDTANGIETLKEELADLETMLVKLKEEADACLSKKKALVFEEKKLKVVCESMERIPEEKISEIVAESTRVNAIATAYEQWEERVELDTAASERLSKAQKAHKAALKAKKIMMDGAEFPLEGLTIHDGILVYNDVFVDNLGKSEQMLVLGCLAIEDALSHDIRAVRMDGIESMGLEDYTKLRDYATEKHVQLFTTRVTRTDDVENHEILIVDGHYPEAEESE